MFRLYKIAIVVLFLLFCCSIAFAEPTQEVKNENSYLGINVEKQPEQDKNEQLITNKKSFLFINIVINGKSCEVKDVSNSEN